MKRYLSDTLTRLANIAEVIHINRMKSKNPRSFVVSIIQEMLTRKCNNVHFGDNTRLLTSLDVELLLQVNKIVFFDGPSFRKVQWIRRVLFFAVLQPLGQTSNYLSARHPSWRQHNSRTIQIRDRSWRISCVYKHWARGDFSRMGWRLDFEYITHAYKRQRQYDFLQVA